MEPDGLRESPAGSGGPEPGDWREETPGEEAEEKVREQKGRAGDGGNAQNVETAGGEFEKDGIKLKEKTENENGDENNIDYDGEEDKKYEEELDPRIQEELEQLNQASVEINQLELQLDEARSSYRKILTDSARKLNTQGSQLGMCIEKARPYYEARRQAKEAQQETQKAALRYERAVSMHTAAREMVYVAEQGLLADRNTLDPTWQEMLNHATAKVNEAEEERLRSEREHQRVTQLCQEAEARVQTLQKNLKRVIVKSKPYFELKAQLNHFLEEHKSKVVRLEERVSKVKTRYSVALRNLEQISEQIHAQRGRRRAARRTRCTYEGRTSPIGAESEGGASGGEVESDWVLSEKTRQWVERHSESGWGVRERAEMDRVGSDTMSVFSLRTIASDLEKCDSVEHLGNLSDVVSLVGDEGEKDRGKTDALEAVRQGQAAWEREAEAAVVAATEGSEKQKSFLKQHHRSVSL
ncbi:SH3 domain-binding protein 5-like [Brienomyrus brachyistius]|uniref:SH3 domain-binding protein 5-like n=1 Tax=Brienomyrus brachyistius TaxID=42636 RepID=UPI0020B328D9|nr:SH3 domain-binding protein 5-like [Brienomyrus brachyistius]